MPKRRKSHENKDDHPVLFAVHSDFPALVGSVPGIAGDIQIWRTRCLEQLRAKPAVS